MRVIAGKFRSRPLNAPSGLDIRPTYDRLKETLFNVLASTGGLEGKIFVDLFAGTGSVGIEALSRGAAHVYFIECERRAVRTIEENLATLRIDGGFSVWQQPVMEGLRQLATEAVRGDIFFLDPPYRMEGAYEQVLRRLAQPGLLAEGALVVAEHVKHFDPGDGTAPLRRYRCLRQGESALSFYAAQ